MVVGAPCWAEVDVEDPDAVTAFYADLLGWTFTAEGAADHHRAVALHDGRPVAAVGSPGAAAPPAWTVYFAVDDADGTADAVEEHGGMLLHGPEDDGHGGRLLVALDPGGATFGAWESDAPGTLRAGPGALCWVDAASAEPGQSRTFYERLFGYTYGTPSPDAPEYRTFDGGDGPLGGIGFAGDALPHWLVCFGVADLDAALGALEAAGGTVVDDPAAGPDGRRRVVVTDPQGARFALRAEG